MSNDEKITLWDKYYKSLNDSYLFPNEYVLRSFLGNYPNLKMKREYRGSKVCDVSCGDGRNMVLLHKLGLQLYGTEVSEEICEITRQKLLRHSDCIPADIRKGMNWQLPFEDDFFDYMLSWNACYYMRDEKSDFSEHVAEYSRALKKDGYLVVSVPGPGCFSLLGAEDLGENLIRINTESKWDILNGSIYYRFNSTDAVADKFGEHFTNFQFATINDDCFGLPLEYFIFVCQKR